MLQRLAALGLVCVLSGCGAGGAVTPAKIPETSPDQGPVGLSPPADQRKPAGLGPAPAGVPAPPAECTAFAAEPPSSCPAGSAQEQLATALGTVSEARDRALRCLEKSTELPVGFVRALRADLAPRACGDVVVGDQAGGSGAARELADALVALGVGARLFRSVREAPLPRPPFDKPGFLKHFKEVLSPWIVQQAHAVDALSQVGPRLSGYAKAVVALEAGLADLRFVEIARSIELPPEMKADPEIRETYLVSLEQALEPRIARGRDAALVGLGELARQGILRDPRLLEARERLSMLYAGRRIDTLDRLLLPALPAAVLDTPELELAATLPAFYSLRLDPTPRIDDARLLRARLERGVAPALWLTQSGSPASAELASIQRRALFELGRLYFWAEPFARAGSIQPASNDAEAALLSALSKVLARGPRNAAALMLGPPTLPAELRETAAVDAIAKQKGPVAGMAEFDAAYVRGLAPPDNDPAFWKEQRARFERARQHLEGAPAKALAADLAKAAADTERELRKHPQP
jgi:hypothetical protein